MGVVRKDRLKPYDELSSTERAERLAGAAGNLNRGQLENLGDASLESIKELGGDDDLGLELYGARVGEGRRVSADVKDILEQRKKSREK